MDHKTREIQISPELWAATFPTRRRGRGEYRIPSFEERQQDAAEVAHLYEGLSETQELPILTTQGEG